MMEAVVSFGTGTSAQIPGVVVAGKTGTAELRDTGTPGASTTQNTDAWFVAFAPAFDPAVVVGVLFDHDGMGGASAAPVAKLLLEEALPLLARHAVPAGAGAGARH